MSSPPLATFTLGTVDDTFAQKKYPAKLSAWDMLPLALSISIIATTSIAAIYLQRRKGKPLFIADHAHPEEEEEEEEDNTEPAVEFHRGQIELRNLRDVAISYPISGYHAGMTDVEVLAPAPRTPPRRPTSPIPIPSPAHSVIDSRFALASASSDDTVVVDDPFSDPVDPFADPVGPSSSSHRDGGAYDGPSSDDESTYVHHPGRRWIKPVRLDLGSEYEGSYRASTFYGKDIAGDPF